MTDDAVRLTIVTRALPMVARDDGMITQRGFTALIGAVAAYQKWLVWTDTLASDAQMTHSDMVEMRAAIARVVLEEGNG